MKGELEAQAIVAEFRDFLLLVVAATTFWRASLNHTLRQPSEVIPYENIS